MCSRWKLHPPPPNEFSSNADNSHLLCKFCDLSSSVIPNCTSECILNFMTAKLIKILMTLDNDGNLITSSTINLSFGKFLSIEVVLGFIYCFASMQLKPESRGQIPSALRSSTLTPVNLPSGPHWSHCPNWEVLKFPFQLKIFCPFTSLAAFSSFSCASCPTWTPK